MCDTRLPVDKPRGFTSNFSIDTSIMGPRVGQKYSAFLPDPCFDLESSAETADFNGQNTLRFGYPRQRLTSCSRSPLGSAQA